MGNVMVHLSGFDAHTGAGWVNDTPPPRYVLVIWRL